MASTTFTATLDAQRPVPTIVLSGAVDRGAEDELFAAWRAARTLPPGRLLLDFSDVSYINSTGIAVVVAVLAQARADNRPLGVYGLSDHYRQVFEITRLVDFMEVYADAEAAVAGASKANRL
jgi:anti-anti-sigma factor